MATTVNVIRGFVSQSVNSGRFPPTRFDDAIAQLDQLGLCRSALWAGNVNSSGIPYDRVTGAAYTTLGTKPPIIAADPDFAFVGAITDGIELPSINCNGAGAFHTGTNSGRFTNSWTLAMVFAPYVSGNFGGLMYGFNASTNAADINAYSAGIKVSMPANNNAFFVTPITLYENAPNIIVICGDADTRQVAVYMNSLTPIVSAEDAVGADPWPDLGSTGAWAFGTQGSNYMNGKFYAAAAFEGSLYHTTGPVDDNDPTPDLPGMLENLIRSAAHDFGITLV